MSTRQDAGGSRPRRNLFGSLAMLSVTFVATLVAVITFQRPALIWEAVAIGSFAFALALGFAVFSSSRYFRRLDAQWFVDGLTGLPNRTAFHADFRRIAGSWQEAAVALIDLDGFLQVNEQYGHAAGDTLLYRCGEMLNALCGSEARVYRLGGDEFALLKTGSYAPTLLESLCRRLVERLAQPIETGELCLAIGASVGLARRGAQEAVESSEMLRQADIAMHLSKRSGKARCSWFTAELDSEREQTRSLEDELRRALRDNQFHVHYQPLVDCKTRMITSVEALIRWERADGKIVGPDVFIPAAEEAGLIHTIGLFVLRRACLDALAWPGIKLSVNLSPAQLRNPEFPVQLGQILEETGFDPSRLELEITETCLVHDPVVAGRSMAMIRNFGASVVLDDFGTGYASFGFLRQFRFEKLKIDRSLISRAGDDEGSRAMMLSSITVARAMRMGVTAEGVETAEQAALVRAAGCDQIQGWIYFRAMPAHDVAKYLGRPVEAAETASHMVRSRTHPPRHSQRKFA